jgi:hypothetical protein
MKQYDIFGNVTETDGEEAPYSTKVKTPIYEPKNKRPEPIELIDEAKTRRLLREIEAANITDEEKKFLSAAAQRHTVFNYTKIADYYSHATPQVQNLMERSALVIIDFGKAIQLGYVKLSDEVAQQYLKDYGE